MNAGVSVSVSVSASRHSREGRHPSGEAARGVVDGRSRQADRQVEEGTPGCDGAMAATNKPQIW